MKLSKQIGTVVLAAMILSSGAFAWGGGRNCGLGNSDCNFQGNCSNKMMNQKSKGYKNSGFNQQGNNSIMYALNNLYLTQDQWRQISIAKDEMRLSMKKSFDPTAQGKYINAKGFDKKAFMEQHKKDSDIRAQYRADFMEKVMNILTQEQKELLVKQLSN